MNREELIRVPDSMIETSMKHLLTRGFAEGELSMMEARGERPEFVTRMRAIKVELEEKSDGTAWYAEARPRTWSG